MTQIPIESRLYIQRNLLVNEGHITEHTSEKSKAVYIYISQSNQVNFSPLSNNQIKLNFISLNHTHTLQLCTSIS